MVRLWLQFNNQDIGFGSGTAEVIAIPTVQVALVRPGPRLGGAQPPAATWEVEALPHIAPGVSQAFTSEVLTKRPKVAGRVFIDVHSHQENALDRLTWSAMRHTRTKSRGVSPQRGVPDHHLCNDWKH